MWKIIVGFALFGALAIFVLLKGGDKVNISGEEHLIPASAHAETPAPAAAPVAASASASADAAAPAAPAADAGASAAAAAPAASK